jgi:hypothetical protein
LKLTIIQTKENNAMNNNIEVITWDLQEDPRPILNRARAGMTAFFNRAYIEGRIQTTSDPTKYESPRGYHDWNRAIKFSLNTKASEWGAKRMAIIQGILLFHITNRERVEDWTKDCTDALGFDRPTLAVSSGTDDGVSIFVGEQIDTFASRLVRQEIANRVIRDLTSFDRSIEWSPTYEHLAEECRLMAASNN